MDVHELRERAAEEAAELGPILADHAGREMWIARWILGGWGSSVGRLRGRVVVERRELAGSDRGLRM